MSDQLTQCPHCQTSFRVTAGQLKSAGGLVRCGSCLGLFSAAINFIRVKPDADDDNRDDDEEFGEPEEILFSDRTVPRHAQPEEYELYEEYEEAPDLLADLTTPHAAASADPDAEAPEPFTLVAEGDDPEAIESGRDDDFMDAADSEWLDSPSEEFKPRTILFDDDDDEVDDDDAIADSDNTADDEAEFDDDYQDEADPMPSGREISLEHGGPVLGELTADEFDSPEISELELDELLQYSDALDDEADTGEYEDEEVEAAELADESAPYEEYLPETAAPPHDDQFDDSDIEEQDEDDELSLDTRQQPGFGDEEADAAAILDEYMEEMHADTRDFGGASDDIPALAARTSKTSPGVSSKPAWLQRQDQVPPEKAALHYYLASLEDDEDLEPLTADHLDEFDDEPVLLAAGYRKRGLLATTGLLLLSLLLMGTLLLQFVDQHLEALRQRNSFARFEPWFCAILECPPPAAPVTAGSSLYSQELLIRSHPRVQGALELSFIFRNDAAEPQPFPGLELSFRDPANTLLANRLLLPADYLPPELRPLAAMPGRSSVQIMLELVDPGAEAVNYTIAFRDL